METPHTNGHTAGRAAHQPSRRPVAATLKDALEGQFLEDVRRHPVPLPETETATWRVLARCPCCGEPILTIVTIRTGEQLAVLYAAITTRSCPGCGAALSAANLFYAGIYSPGCWAVPVTPVTASDLALALNLLEIRK